MKKLWILLALASLLCGCTSEETLETISDDIVQPVMVQPGEISVRLPDNAGFSLRYQRISGDIRSDFDLRTSLNAKSGTAVYLDGGNCTYSMKTVSGDLLIYRR